VEERERVCIEEERGEEALFIISLVVERCLLLLNIMVSNVAHAVRVELMMRRTRSRDRLSCTHELFIKVKLADVRFPD
jgi:hypothetical protein